MTVRDDLVVGRLVWVPLVPEGRVCVRLVPAARALGWPLWLLLRAVVELRCSLLRRPLVSAGLGRAERGWRLAD
ncbi:MAG TPA: hypothetical protein GXZ30_13920 [Propionibacterium sp.]|nr:hypothetical protein [Propionibacterium sp.]